MEISAVQSASCAALFPAIIPPIELPNTLDFKVWSPPHQLAIINLCEVANSQWFPSVLLSLGKANRIFSFLIFSICYRQREFIENEFGEMKQ